MRHQSHQSHQIVLTGEECRHCQPEESGLADALPVVTSSVSPLHEKVVPPARGLRVACCGQRVVKHIRPFTGPKTMNVIGGSPGVFSVWKTRKAEYSARVLYTSHKFVSPLKLLSGEISHGFVEIHQGSRCWFEVLGTRRSVYSSSQMSIYVLT